VSELSPVDTQENLGDTIVSLLRRLMKATRTKGMFQ
jgi:hypothetical protein